MKVLGMGNALVDVIVSLNDDKVLEDLALPKGSMQLIFDDRLSAIQEVVAKYTAELTSGGSAANTIHGLAALGLETGFVGSIGKDDYGKFFRDDLEQHNIKPILRESDNPSGRAHAFVSPDSERTFGTYLGAALELASEHLNPDLFVGYDCLYIEGYLVQNHDLIESAVQMAKAAGLMVALDLASYNVVEENLDFLLNLLEKHVDLVFANEEEAKAISGAEPEAALKFLSDRCNQAVVKVGRKGSLIYDKHGDLLQIEPIVAKAVDTSGAGDLYAAGFIYGLSKKLSPLQCGQIGSILSGKVIEIMGPKLPQNIWSDILALIKRIESYEDPQ